MILFINACVRADSRTKKLADHLLSKLNGEVSEIRLIDIDFPKVDEAFLERRYALIDRGEFDAPEFSHARQFAAADEIVIAAPYWDLSFPSILKQYFEQICILGITFDYSDMGYPRGLCRADRMYYVYTAGGMFVPDVYGPGYVESLAKDFFGIEEMIPVKAMGLDIKGADPEAILKDAIDGIKDIPEK